MATNSKEFVAEIRDMQDHESHNMEDDADVTVTADTLHSSTGANEFKEFTNLRVYLLNTHDQGFDVDVQHASPRDDGFTAPTTAATVTLAADPGGASVELSGPVGALQIVARTGALTAAPASGDLQVTVDAVR